MSKSDLLKQIEILQDENKELRKELEETRSLYCQLIKETSKENYDERRVNLLKSQVMQLERQVLLLNNSISKRSDILIEANSSFLKIANLARQYIAKEVSGPDVPVARSDLTQVVQMSEQARSRLSKKIENEEENPYHPFLVPETFIHPSKAEINILDICTPNLEHINLRQVGKLESRLCKMYKQLLGLQESLTTYRVSHKKKMSGFYDNQPLLNRLEQQIETSATSLRQCTEELQDLAVLVPTAPWAPLNRQIVKDISIKDILKRLPSFPRNQQKDGRLVIESLLKTVNYKSHLSKLEITALKEETEFHKGVYKHQIQYTEALFKSLTEGYKEFEEELCSTVKKPLNDILEMYQRLAVSASDEDLRLFLATFKNYSTVLSDIAEGLEPKGDSDEVITEYESQFRFSRQDLEETCQKNVAKVNLEFKQIESEMERCLKNVQDIFEPEGRVASTMCDESSPGSTEAGQGLLSEVSQGLPTSIGCEGSPMLPDNIGHGQVGVDSMNTAMGLQQDKPLSNLDGNNRQDQDITDSIDDDFDQETDMHRDVAVSPLIESLPWDNSVGIAVGGVDVNGQQLIRNNNLEPIKTKTTKKRPPVAKEDKSASTWKAASMKKRVSLEAIRQFAKISVSARGSTMSRTQSEAKIHSSSKASTASSINLPRAVSTDSLKRDVPKEDITPTSSLDETRLTAPSRGSMIPMRMASKAKPQKPVAQSKLRLNKK